MDREQGAQPALRRVAVLRFEQHRQHRGVPVVAVQHVGLEVQARDRLSYGAGKERVLFALGHAAAVDFIAVIALVVHEIDDYAVDHELLNADILMAPAEINVKIGHVLDAPAELLLDDPVIRRDDARIHAEIREILRQRADHVGETAGLRQRRTFRRGEQHTRQLPAMLFRQFVFEKFFHILSPLSGR